MILLYWKKTNKNFKDMGKKKTQKKPEAKPAPTEEPKVEKEEVKVV